MTEALKSSSAAPLIALAMSLRPDSPEPEPIATSYVVPS